MKGWHFIEHDLRVLEFEPERALTWWLWREIGYILEWEVPRW